MKSNITRLVALIFSCVFLFCAFSTVSASSNRASDYFSYTEVWATPQGNGKFIVEFDINATHRMDQLGADKIYIWEQQSDGSYDNVKTFTKNVTIAPKALKTANIKLKENSFTYTGKAITPDFDIVIDGKVISPAKYTVSYTNNINAGTATITVKGVAGSTEYDPATAAKLNFEIKPADTTKLVGVIGAKEYKGYSLEVPADEISLKLGDSDVDVASNFKLTYGENLKIGEGTVTLTPKNGNFTGTKTLTFNIVGKNVSAENAIKTYDANGDRKSTRLNSSH